MRNPQTLCIPQRKPRADAIACYGRHGHKAPFGIGYPDLVCGKQLPRTEHARFPTQGQTSNADGINAYVFSERGIFRPGETLRFGMLMRRGDWKALPPDMPFFAELSDPSERTILRRQFVVGADGLAELSWTVPEGAPTGRYRLDVQTPNADGFDFFLV